MDIGGSLTKIAYYSTVPFKKIAYDSIDPSQESEVWLFQYKGWLLRN